MKSAIRDIFPGGNTPFGFHSYYNHILSQRKAQKLFCIKGGPGVGKSTLMKELAELYISKGENVDRFWCSSDPSSLDGVLLKDRNVAIVDGTAPHIIDPVNPGAVDEIVNLGDFLNTEGLRKERDKIISCNEMISERFKAAYVYLKRASSLYEHMESILEEVVCDVSLDIHKAMISDSKVNGRGEVRRFFAGAITPEGVKSSVETLCRNIDRVFIVKAPVGAGTYHTLKRLSNELSCRGFDVEEYYCPMKPDIRLEHIVSEEAGIAVFTVNEYHGRELITEDYSLLLDACEAEKRLTGFARDTYERMKLQSGEDIQAAVSMLKSAKEMHDMLESYYIRNIDFKRIKKVKREIIAKIG